MEIDDKTFTSLINFSGINDQSKLNWTQIDALQSLSRKMFPGELYWRENENCNGFQVSKNPNCELRNEEMNLILYSPEVCSNGTIKDCSQLVSYVRVNATN